MTAGKPLTPAANDALLINAVDMWDEGRRKQLIRSRGYDGVIHSNLEVIDYLGVPAVIFEAMVATPEWGATEVRYAVRVDDLDGIELGSWGRIVGGDDHPLFQFLHEEEDD